MRKMEDLDGKEEGSTKWMRRMRNWMRRKDEVEEKEADEREEGSGGDRWRN
jgi:hypothetical protein